MRSEGEGRSRGREDCAGFDEHSFAAVTTHIPGGCARPRFEEKLAA